MAIYFNVNFWRPAAWDWQSKAKWLRIRVGAHANASVFCVTFGGHPYSASKQQAPIAYSFHIAYSLHIICTFLAYVLHICLTFLADIHTNFFYLFAKSFHIFAHSLHILQYSLHNLRTFLAHAGDEQGFCKNICFVCRSQFFWYRASTILYPASWINKKILVKIFWYEYHFHVEFF